MLHIPQPPSLKSKSCILQVAPEQRFGIKDLRRGIRFYSSEYLQDSLDPVSEKTSFSGKKSQKNYSIGYATLIAPEISSEIKPGMYISLLFAHVGLYYVENLYYCDRECCHCGFMCSPPAGSLCGYKRWVRSCCQKHRCSEAMDCFWAFLQIHRVVLPVLLVAPRL